MTAVMPSTCSEHELIAAARQGDDRAFEELYARYRDRICAFIRSRIADYGRAEDIGQEVFMSALRRLRASTGPIQFKPWIYEIAKNACIDEYRRSRRAHEVSLDIDEDAGGPRPPLSLAPTPAAAVEAKQSLLDLQGAFGGLSESHHQLLVLRELEGLSYDEIGARTGMSRQMVESALFRARRKLTEEYNELASGRRCQQVQGAIEDGRVTSLESLGIRERRQFARHLAHCQPCRITAHMAGLDQSLVKPRRIAAKIAAFLPFPVWRWPWRGSRAARNVVGHPTALHSVQSAAMLSEPAGASALGGAAVAATALALAGVGAGLAPGASSHYRGITPQPSALTRSAHPIAPGQASAAGLGSVARPHKVAVLGTRRTGIPGGPAAARAPHQPSATPERSNGSGGNTTSPVNRSPTGAPTQSGALPSINAPAASAAGTPAVPAPGRPSVKTIGQTIATATGRIKNVAGSAGSSSTKVPAPGGSTQSAGNSATTVRSSGSAAANSAPSTVVHTIRSVGRLTTGG